MKPIRLSNTIYQQARPSRLPSSAITRPTFRWHRSSSMSTNKTSHLERTASEPREKELYSVRLGRVDRVNERVRLFRLELPCHTKFLPGQWLDTYVPEIPKAGGFTITSPPSTAAAGPNPYLELAVQDSPDNPAAAWLWRPEEDILGATLEVRIGGSFVFPPAGLDGEKVRRVVLVAGGVGVNPLMSILSHIGETNTGTEVRVMYGSKVPRGGVGSIVFVDRIAGLFREGKVRGSVRLFATAEPAQQHLDELSGKGALETAGVEVQRRRMSVKDVEEAVTSGGREDSTLVYVCGPPAMTDEFAAKLISKDGMAMDPTKVLTEKWW